MRPPFRLPRALPRHALSALLAIALFAACQHAPPAAENDAPACSHESQAQLQPLLQLIAARLVVAPQVAQSKWNSGAPIDDPVRERLILDDVARQARAAGLEPDVVTVFFQAQFDAGKHWQLRLHRQWRAAQQPPFAATPDLGRDVRPVLDRLTPQLIATLRAAQPVLRQPGCRARLQRAAAQPPAAVDT
ncbi:MAG: gamma subclass chorismate mutase AroQ, partial [Burkholderiaceae bacterium]